MKAFLALCALFLTTALGYPQGAQMIIKNRAKELQNENNVRQGVPPPTQPQSPPAQAQPVTPPPIPAYVTHLQTDLAAIKSGSTPTAEQKQKLAADIVAA